MASLVTNNSSNNNSSNNNINHNLQNLHGYNRGEKQKLWHQASLNLTGQNTYHIIHGGPKKGVENIPTQNLITYVPDNVIIVILAPPDTVLFGNAFEDLEILNYIKNPNWIKSRWDGTNTNNSIDPSTKGFHYASNEMYKDSWNRKVSEEPVSTKNFLDQLKWTDQRDNEIKQQISLTSSMGVLHGAQVFFPGDPIYDQNMTFDDNDRSFDSYLLEAPYDNQLISSGLFPQNEQTYRDVYMREKLGELSRWFGFFNGNNYFENYNEMERANINDTAKEELAFELYHANGNLQQKKAPIYWKTASGQLIHARNPILEWRIPERNPIFNRDIVYQEQWNRKKQGATKKMDTLSELMQLWSLQAKNEQEIYRGHSKLPSGIVIHYLNSCSPTITSKDFKDLKGFRTKYNSSGVKSKHQIRKDVWLGQRLTQHNMLRQSIFNYGRQNINDLRHRWVGHNNIPIPEVGDLPRIGLGLFRLSDIEREEWYVNVMGSYFKQLKSPNATGHEGLKVLYDQAVRYDTSGIMRRGLYKAFDSNYKQHGPGSPNNTWLINNQQWVQNSNKIPHWEEGWLVVQDSGTDTFATNTMSFAQTDLHSDNPEKEWLKQLDLVPEDLNNLPNDFDNIFSDSDFDGSNSDFDNYVDDPFVDAFKDGDDDPFVDAFKGGKRHKKKTRKKRKRKKKTKKRRKKRTLRKKSRRRRKTKRRRR